MGRSRLLGGRRRRIAEAGGRGVGGGRENGGRLQHGLLRRIIGARRALVLLFDMAALLCYSCPVSALEGPCDRGRSNSQTDWMRYSKEKKKKKATRRPESEQPAVGGRAAACWRNAVTHNPENRATARCRLFSEANRKGSPKHRARKIL